MLHKDINTLRKLRNQEGVFDRLEQSSNESLRDSIENFLVSPECELEEAKIIFTYPSSVILASNDEIYRAEIQKLDDGSVKLTNLTNHTENIDVKSVSCEMLDTLEYFSRKILENTDESEIGLHDLANILDNNKSLSEEIDFECELRLLELEPFYKEEVNFTISNTGIIKKIVSESEEEIKNYLNDISKKLKSELGNFVNMYTSNNSLFSEHKTFIKSLLEDVKSFVKLINHSKANFSGKKLIETYDRLAGISDSYISSLLYLTSMSGK